MERITAEKTGEKRIAQIGRICFWAGLLLELLIVVVDTSAWTNPFEGQLFRLTFLLFSVKVLCSRFTLREWLWLLFFGVLAGVCYLCSDRDEAVRLVVESGQIGSQAVALDRDDYDEAYGDLGYINPAAAQNPGPRPSRRAGVSRRFRAKRNRSTRAAADRTSSTRSSWNSTRTSAKWSRPDSDQGSTPTEKSCRRPRQKSSISSKACLIWSTVSPVYSGMDMASMWA